MNSLPFFFYILFPVRRADYKILVINLLSYHRLSRNAAFTNQIEKTVGDHNSSDYLYLKIWNLKKKKINHFIKEFDWENLKRLHLESISHNESFRTGPHKNLIYLLTERFFWKTPTLNLGSSRHGLLYDYQIKGLGRNPLATRGDYHHSWGGVHLWQGLNAYIKSHLLAGLSPLGILQTTMVSIKNSDGHDFIRADHTTQIMREADSIRVTQVCTQFEREAEKEEVAKLILSRTNTEKFDDHFEKIIFHYVSLYLLGVKNTSVTKENITLEGKLIDYEDHDISWGKEHTDYFLILSSTDSGKKIYTSSLHLYLDAIELTSVGLEHLGFQGHTREEIEKKFWEMTLKLSNEVFDLDAHLIDWTHSVLHLKSSYFRGNFRDHSSCEDVSKLAEKFSEKFILTNSQESEEGQRDYYHLRFNKIQFKNKQINDLCLSNNFDFNSLVHSTFRKIQLETMSGSYEKNEALEISDFINKKMIEQSVLFPFVINDGKISLSLNNFKDFQDQWQEKIKEMNCELITTVTRESQDFIIALGFNIQIENRSHTVCLPKGILFSKNKMISTSGDT
jgi:hypothetical protein